MRTPAQLTLVLPFSEALTREDFIVSGANAKALAFVESWPDWISPVAAVYAPPGCGKTHLTSIWQAKSGAEQFVAATLGLSAVREQRPRIIEDIDTAVPTRERDIALFAAMQVAGKHAPLLLTGITPPSEWPCILPDLASRFSTIVAVPMGNPDETMLAGLARKLFTDRQLMVPDEVIEQMLVVLERTPAAVRAFVAEADSAALAEARPVNISMVRRLLTTRLGSS
jgi:chromosomal replication initiation ATPase DnaA